MYIAQTCSTKLIHPTILLVYPHKEVSDIIRDDLIDLGCTVIVAHTRLAALAGLAYCPDLVILDVIMPQIDFSLERRRLTTYLQEGLLCCDDYWASIDQLKKMISAEEQREDGIALAEEIRSFLPDAPVIFMSLDPMLLQSLPFGEAFCLGNQSIYLPDLVEHILEEHSFTRRIEQRDTAIVELPQKIGAHYADIRY